MVGYSVLLDEFVIGMNSSSLNIESCSVCRELLAAMCLSQFAGPCASFQVSMCSPFFCSSEPVSFKFNKLDCT